MGPDEFRAKICGQYDDPSLRNTFIHMECPGRSVVGRYLVVQTDSSYTTDHVVCEIQAKVECKGILNYVMYWRKYRCAINKKLAFRFGNRSTVIHNIYTIHKYIANVKMSGQAPYLKKLFKMRSFQPQVYLPRLPGDQQLSDTSKMIINWLHYPTPTTRHAWP